MDDIINNAFKKFESKKLSIELLLKDYMCKKEEERIKHALQFLIKFSRPPKLQNQQKNSDNAQLLIGKAIKMTDQKLPMEIILKTYSAAVANAPVDHIYLGLAYGNRSASLCNGFYYEDSLKDITRALRQSYPDALKAQLYVRRAKNLLGINSTMCPDVERAIEDAYRYFPYTNEANKVKLKKTITKCKLAKPGTFPKPARKWDDRLFLPKTPSGNANILRVSDGITISYNEEFGRHIVATRDIEAGESIMVHKAYVSTLYQDHFHNYCWYCMSRTLSNVACIKCVNVIFCDETCRDRAWKDYHDIECPVITGLSSEPINSIDVTSLQVTIKAFKECDKSFRKLKAKILAIDGLTDPIDKAFTDGVFNDTKYASVCTLTRKTEEPIILFQYALRSACILYYLAANTEIFGEKIYDLKILMENKWALFMGGLILRNLEIVMANGIGVLSNDDDGNTIKKGGQLISFQSLFNHSCDPNAYQYISGDMNAIITFDTIKKGRQIFINYGPGYTDMTTDARRRNLQRAHKFFCDCGACDNNWGPDTRIPCFTELSIPNSVKDTLHEIKKKYNRYQYPLSFKMVENISTDNIQKILSTLFEAINDYRKHLDIPCQEVQILKISLTKIYNALNR